MNAYEKAQQLKAALRGGVKAVSAPNLFPTPPDVAAQMADILDIFDGARVLEPSAGTGRLIQAVIDEAHDMRITVKLDAIEIKQSLADDLARRFPNFDVHCMDFMTARLPDYFDRVIMNPPFNNGEDIKHIRRAFDLLKQGGRLVAICADGPRQRAALKDQASDWIELPAGTFSGTSVRSVIVVLDKD